MSGSQSILRLCRRSLNDAAPLYDYVFCQGTEAVELLNHAGIKGAHWLPMACDPDFHRPVKLSDQEKRWYGNDVAFVGLYYSERVEVLERLSDFDLGIWGISWDRLPEDSSLRPPICGGITTPEEWVETYSAWKIAPSIIGHPNICRLVLGEGYEVRSSDDKD